MITELKGNVLQNDAQVIAHQVNCLGIMGAGLALQIKQQRPSVFNSYAHICSAFPINELLGMFQLHQSEKNGQFIANLFGQKSIGCKMQPIDTDYDALKKAMTGLRNEMVRLNITSIAFPKYIGCGLAGGDWNIVKPMIEEIFANFDVRIVKFSR